MIGRWSMAAALLVLTAASVAILGLAAALLGHAGHDLPRAFATLSALAAPNAGPGPLLAFAGRAAIVDGAIAAALAAVAGLVLGLAQARLSRPIAGVLAWLALVPALTLLALGGLTSVLLIGQAGPVTALLAGFAVATQRVGVRAALAVALTPLVMRAVAAAARQLGRPAFESLATLGFGPSRRLFAVAAPAVLPAALRAAVVGFLVAAAFLFLRAWPVPARQDLAAAAAATIDQPALAALALALAVVAAAILAAITARSWPEPARGPRRE